MRPAELHSPSAEENCLTANVASLRSVKVATPPCAAKAATVDGYMVKIGVFKKAGRKTALCGPVKELLVDNLQRRVSIPLKEFIMILLVAGLGIGLADEKFLCLKGKNILLHALNLSGVVIAALFLQLSQQIILGTGGGSLQNIVDRPDCFRSVTGRVVFRVGHFQIP